MNNIAIIIVTHNSENYFDQCMHCLVTQSTPPSQIIIIDSGSQNPQYLEKYQHNPNVQIHVSKENIGFCQGNNLGFSFVLPNIDYVLFLNPDAFLTSTFIEQAFLYMRTNQSVGALTGLLLGYDLHQRKPSGKIDSSGIFRTWYGRWYDRSHGEEHQQSQFSHAESVPALCGALMFCRKAALDSVALKPNQVMDPAFFMYKEDIDLSVRLRKKGWELKLIPLLVAHHCRGWQKIRSQVPKQFRLLSAKNEMRLHARMRSPCVIYSALKYLSVKFLNV